MDDTTRTQREHEAWRAEHRHWIDEVEQWRAERAEAAAVLERASRALNKHGASIDVHAETIEAHEELIDSHEAFISSTRGRPEQSEGHDLLGRMMAQRHSTEHASHTVQRNLHDKIAARHAALIEQIKRLEALLEAP